MALGVLALLLTASCEYAWSAPRAQIFSGDKSVVVYQETDRLWPPPRVGEPPPTAVIVMSSVFRLVSDKVAHDEATVVEDEVGGQRGYHAPHRQARPSVGGP